jgi:hypothetical protein
MRIAGVTKVIKTNSEKLLGRIKAVLNWITCGGREEGAPQGRKQQEASGRHTGAKLHFQLMCPPFPTIHNPILDLCLVDICNKLQ